MKKKIAIISVIGVVLLLLLLKGVIMRDPHKHTFGGWAIIQTATEQQEGLKKRKCRECGYIESVVIPMLVHEHEMGEPEVVKYPNCVEEGLIKTTCITCGFVDEVVFKDEDSHTFSEWEVVKESTTTEQGVQKRTCSVCQKVEEAKLPLHVHEMADLEIVKSPTCHETGSLKRKCKGCDYEETEEIPVDEEAHQGTWEVIKESTETVPGLIQRVCTICGKTETEELPLHTHKMSNMEIVKAPTCLEEGSYRTKCVSCDYVEIVKLEIDPTAHQGTWEIIIEPTSTEKGLRQLICTICGETQLEEFENDNATHTHDLQFDSLVEANCKEDGKVIFKCSSCEYVKETVLPKTEDHVFTEWEMTKLPTETEPGIIERDCTICGKHEEREMSAQ